MATTLVVAALFAAAAASASTPVTTIEGPKIAPAEFNGDVRLLPSAPASALAPKLVRPLLKPPFVTKSGGGAPAAPNTGPVPGAAMPAPSQNFAGLDFNATCTGGQCGSGWPPDTNGDVGPNHYIIGVNTAYAIYSKTGALAAAFTEDALWSSAGAITCNGASQGDPIVLHDAIADRWILTHFAFTGAAGPFYQCIAVSKTSDPVAGGWWLYQVRMDAVGGIPSGALNDYGKFGLWHDCLYMGANEFQGFGSYLGASFASFSRADMYAGRPATWSVGFLPYGTYGVFSMFPANSAGSGAAAVQPGTPAWYVSESQTTFGFEVRKYTPGPNCGGGGTLSAATIVPQATYSTNSAFYNPTAPQPGTAATLDHLADRVMQKLQYRKVGAVESLWVVHTVPLDPTGQTAVQWAQLNVTGGTAAATAMQQQIFSPDATLYRFMPSLAVDNQGNVAIGYSTSGTTAPRYPTIAYVGRLATDPPNTLPQGETILQAGAGSQTLNCGTGGGFCDRWGDYTAMSVDPTDDCTFWYTNQYYSSGANGASGNWQTRIGSFRFPACTGPSVTTVQRTFVSAVGNDANACTLAAPCRTFAVAVQKTTSGGEVVALDSAGYGSVVITKPLTIVGPAGIYAGISVLSGTGVVVNPVVGTVTLRGLAINAQGGATGIDFQSGDALYLDNVSVTGFPTIGLNALAAATGTVEIRNSSFRFNGTGASFGTTGGTSAVLTVGAQNTQFDGNTTAIQFTGWSAQGEFRSTTLAGGTTGALLQPTLAGASSRVTFVDSTITKNSGTGILAGGAAGAANVDVSRSLVSGNGTGVAAALNGSIFVTDSVITRNATGVAPSGGTITSGTLNRLYQNTSNGGFSGTTSRQ